MPWVELEMVTDGLCYLCMKPVPRTSITPCQPRPASHFLHKGAGTARRSPAEHRDADGFAALHRSQEESLAEKADALRKVCTTLEGPVFAAVKQELSKQVGKRLWVSLGPPSP